MGRMGNKSCLERCEKPRMAHRPQMQPALFYNQWSETVSFNSTKAFVLKRVGGEQQVVATQSSLITPLNREEHKRKPCLVLKTHRRTGKRNVFQEGDINTLKRSNAKPRYPRPKPLTCMNSFSRGISSCVNGYCEQGKECKHGYEHLINCNVVHPSENVVAFSVSLKTHWRENQTHFLLESFIQSNMQDYDCIYCFSIVVPWLSNFQPLYCLCNTLPTKP